MSQRDPVQIDLIGTFLRGKDLLDCQRYHTKLTREACDRYRKRNADICEECQGYSQRLTKRTEKSNDQRPNKEPGVNGLITVDLRELPNLLEALDEEAGTHGRELVDQIVSILKGWFE